MERRGGGGRGSSWGRTTSLRRCRAPASRYHRPVRSIVEVGKPAPDFELESDREKYGLPFTILADPERRAGAAYDVTKPDSRSFERSTFIIDAEGNVARILRRVKPDEHAELVLSALG